MDFEGGGDTPKEEKVYTVDEAVAAIQMKIQEIHQMGNNDAEIPTLQEVIQRVKKGDIPPSEGVKQAFETLYGKQDWGGGH